MSGKSFDDGESLAGNAHPFDKHCHKNLDLGGRNAVGSYFFTGREV
jgi:hypothetical protein